MRQTEAPQGSDALIRFDAVILHITARTEAQ
jgi:hypothetical protein